MITVKETRDFNYRVVVVVPAGRRRYMELILPKLLKEIDIIDEIRYCVNTNVQEDIDWMESVSRDNPKITLDKRLGIAPYQGERLKEFWTDLRDPNTIYIRLDDDIVWLEENFITKMLDFRVENPDYLFVLPNIINNSITDYLHQHLGALDIPETIEYDCFSENGVRNGSVVVKKHENFLKHYNEGTLNSYKFNKWILRQYERISINSLCWFGRSLEGVEVDPDEENYIACELPRLLQKPNIVNGNVLAVHFAFHTHRDELEKTNILERYTNLPR
jgi:hypothetical protein